VYTAEFSILLEEHFTNILQALQSSFRDTSRFHIAISFLWRTFVDLFLELFRQVLIVFVLATSSFLLLFDRRIRITIHIHGGYG
jgi:hypothetical protein